MLGGHSITRAAYCPHRTRPSRCEHAPRCREQLHDGVKPGVSADECESGEHVTGARRALHPCFLSDLPKYVLHMTPSLRVALEERVNVCV